MDSVIVGQRIHRRQKPVRIIPSANAFIYTRDNSASRRAERREPVTIANQRPGRRAPAFRWPQFVAQRLSRPSANGAGSGVAAIAPVSLLRAAAAFRQNAAGLGQPNPAGLSGRASQASRLRRIALLAGCALLVILAGAWLIMPVRPAPAVEIGKLELPAPLNLDTYLLEMFRPAEPDSSAPAGELPVMLDTFDYRVAANDTLEAIGRRFGIRVETLISLNTIRDVRRLQAGAILHIPNLDGIIHTVKPGDSLAALARNYDKSIYDLVDVNDLDSEVLSPNQVLFIPGARLPEVELQRALGTLVAWPLTGRISSPFGYRNSPITGVRQFHGGLDIVGPRNTPIGAAMNGRVAETGYSAIYGNFVILTHHDGYQTLYAHLSSIQVRSGQSLSQGTVVGLLGSTGLSTGPHLHFGFYRNGRALDPISMLPRR